MLRRFKRVGVFTYKSKVGKGLSRAPEKQPYAHSGRKKHGQPADRGKLRLIIVLAEFDLAIGRKGEANAQNQEEAR